MTDQHPLEKARITRDRDETGDYLIIHDASPNHPAKPDGSLVERVAQWGYDQRGEVNEAKLQQARDQELEAYCGWLVLNGYVEAASRLRAARRPKPPSLAEQALEALRSTPCTEQRHYDALFAALERLKQLEDSND